MAILTTIPELANQVAGLIVTLERHGDHWDLVVVPYGTTAAEALKPRWRIRTEAFPSFPEDADWTALEHAHQLMGALQGFLSGYHERCA